MSIKFRLFRFPITEVISGQFQKCYRVDPVFRPRYLAQWLFPLCESDLSWLPVQEAATLLFLWRRDQKPIEPFNGCLAGKG